MRRWIIAAGVVGGLTVAGGWLAGCSTMSKDQCLAGAWGEKGYADGAAGYPMSRLDGHAKACAKYQVAPNPPPMIRRARMACGPIAPSSGVGRKVGRAIPITASVGRRRSRLSCPPITTGLRLHEVEAAFETAESALNSAEARIANRQDKLEAKERELDGEGLTDQERERIRNRIQEVRGEIREARRDARDARDALDRAEWDVRRVRRELSGRYPV